MLEGAPSMKCYRKNGSDSLAERPRGELCVPSMKCYRKNGSDLLNGQPRMTIDGPQ